MLTLVLALVALILALISLFQSRGSALLGWAVLCLALVYLVPQFT